MKNMKIKALTFAALLALAATSLAATIDVSSLKILFVRAVGQYQDPAYSNTMELWFTTPLTFPAGSPCTETKRVYIDSKNYHLIAAAYMAFSKARTVNITLDTTLPIRAGACEITYLDVLAQ